MNDETRKIIGENLKRFRKEKGITQTDLAVYLGSTKTTVATWEQGKGVPDIEMAYRIMQYYNLAIEKLFEGVPDDH